MRLTPLVRILLQPFLPSASFEAPPLFLVRQTQPSLYCEFRSIGTRKD